MGETPLGAVARGLAAGLAGTAAMTAYQELVSKMRSSGGEGSEGESSGGSEGSQEQQDWSQAPAPAQVGRRIIEGVFQREVPKEKIGLLTNLVHFSYGTAWGSVYGLVEGTIRARALPSGLLFGSSVWGTGYVVLPAMKIYKPLWEYPPKTLAVDLSYHLVYGLGVAAAYRALEKI